MRVVPFPLANEDHWSRWSRLNWQRRQHPHLLVIYTNWTTDRSWNRTCWLKPTISYQHLELLSILRIKTKTRVTKKIVVFHQNKFTISINRTVVRRQIEKEELLARILVALLAIFLCSNSYRHSISMHLHQWNNRECRGTRMRAEPQLKQQFLSKVIVLLSKGHHHLENQHRNDKFYSALSKNKTGENSRMVVVKRKM